MNCIRLATEMNIYSSMFISNKWNEHSKSTFTFGPTIFGILFLIRERCQNRDEKKVKKINRKDVTPTKPRWLRKTSLHKKNV